MWSRPCHNVGFAARSKKLFSYLHTYAAPAYITREKLNLHCHCTSLFYHELHSTRSDRVYCQHYLSLRASRDTARSFCPALAAIRIMHSRSPQITVHMCHKNVSSSMKRRDLYQFAPKLLYTHPGLAALRLHPFTATKPPENF